MKKEDAQFGQYLRNLRESRELSAKIVEEKIASLYSHKNYQISAGYLTVIERGEKPAPHPLKLKALAQVYGEDYQLMLYKAGYVDHNPATQPKEWNKKTIRDLYFDQVGKDLVKRAFSEEEKKAIEKLIEVYAHARG